jgi:hypothetical protein
VCVSLALLVFRSGGRFEVTGLGFGVSGFWFLVSAPGVFKVHDSGFRLEGGGIQGFGLRV